MEGWSRETQERPLQDTGVAWHLSRRLENAQSDFLPITAWKTNSLVHGGENGCKQRNNKRPSKFVLKKDFQICSSVFGCQVEPDDKCDAEFKSSN